MPPSAPPPLAQGSSLRALRSREHACAGEGPAGRLLSGACSSARVATLRPCPWSPFRGPSPSGVFSVALERAQSRYLLVGAADASVALFDLDGVREAYERGRAGAAGVAGAWAPGGLGGAPAQETRVRVGGGEAVGRAPVVESVGGGAAGRGPRDGGGAAERGRPGGGGAFERAMGGAGAAVGGAPTVDVRALALPPPARAGTAGGLLAVGDVVGPGDGGDASSDDALDPGGLEDILAIIEGTAGPTGDPTAAGQGAAAADAAARLWAPAAAQPVAAPPLPPAPLLSLDSPAVPSDAPLFQVTRSAANAHRFSVSCLCWSPAAPHAFVSGSFDHSVKVWDAATGRAVETVELPARVYALGMSPLQSGSTRGLVAVGTGNRDVGLFDPRAGGGGGDAGAGAAPWPVAHEVAAPRQIMTVLRGHDAGVWSLAWSPSNEYVLLTGGSDGRALVWDVRKADGCLMSLDAGAEEGAGLRRRRRTARGAERSAAAADACSPTRQQTPSLSSLSLSRSMTPWWTGAAARDARQAAVFRAAERPLRTRDRERQRRVQRGPVATDELLLGGEAADADPDADERRAQLLLGTPDAGYRFAAFARDDEGETSDDAVEPGGGGGRGRERERVGSGTSSAAFGLSSAAAALSRIPPRLPAAASRRAPSVSSADRAVASASAARPRPVAAHASLPASLFPRDDRSEGAGDEPRRGRGPPPGRGLPSARRATPSSSPPSSRPRLDAPLGAAERARRGTEPPLSRSAPTSWWDAQRLADPRVSARERARARDRDGRVASDAEPSTGARGGSGARSRASRRFSADSGAATFASTSASSSSSSSSSRSGGPASPSGAPPARPVQDPFFRASRDPFTPDPFSPSGCLSRGAPYALSSRARLARAHAGSVTGAVAPPHGETWITAGTDDACRAWRSADGADLRLHFPDAFNHATKARELGYAPQARALFVPTGSAVAVYDAERGGRPLAVLRGAHFESINACVWNERCEELYTAGGDGRVVVWAPRRARGGGGTLTRRGARALGGAAAASAAADDLDDWSDDDDDEDEEEEVQDRTREPRRGGRGGRQRARDIVDDDLAALGGWEDGGFL